MPNTNGSKAWVGWVFKGLGLLIIPILIWAVSLQVSQAVADTERAAIEASAVTIRASVTALHKTTARDLRDAGKRSRGVEKLVQTNTVTLGRMEAQLKGIEGNLSEIKRMLYRAP